MRSYVETFYPHSSSAMNHERNEKLESEAVAFFAVGQPECRTGTLDFQEAALRTFDRD
jgi:hypothetical protein